MKTALSLCLLLSTASAASAAVVCRWVDAQGRTHLADTVPERYRARAQCTVSAAPNAQHDRKLREYLDSEACFARYRNPNNRTIRAEAFRHCKEVVDPR